MADIATDYFNNISVAADALEDVSTARIALEVISSKMKYNRDLKDIIEVLISAEGNLEESLEKLNGYDMTKIIDRLKHFKKGHQEAKSLKDENLFLKEAYTAKMEETHLLSQIIYDKQKLVVA